VERFNRHRVAVLSVGVLAIVACLDLMGAGQADKPASKKWPPQFPREGATKLFENEHVIVWEQVGRPKEPFVHKHVRDILTFGLQPGRVETLGPDGKKTDGTQEGSTTVRIYSRSPNSLTYTKAGLGPHAEVANDPNNIPRSIFVELKGTEPTDCAQWSTACP
jgi:hypothetical protein